MTSGMYNKIEYRKENEEEYILEAQPNRVYIGFQFTKYSFQRFKRYNLPNISLSNLYQRYAIYISIKFLLKYLPNISVPDLYEISSKYISTRSRHQAPYPNNLPLGD